MNRKEVKSNPTTIATATVTDIVTTGQTQEPAASTQSDSVSSQILTTTALSSSCPICYEDFAAATSLGNDDKGSSNNRLETLLPCQHVCCRDCLYEHCQYGITLHRVPIGCPQHLLDPNHTSRKTKNTKFNRTRKKNNHATTTSIMCSTALGHSFVHDIVCRCQLGVEPVEDVDDPLHAQQEIFNTMQQRLSPAIVICRKQDPLWNKYVHSFEKQQQLQQKLLSLQQKQPQSSDAVSSSQFTRYNTSVVVSHSPSSGDSDNDDPHHADADETDSFATACADMNPDTVHAMSTTNTTGTDTATTTAVASPLSKNLEARGSAPIRTSTIHSSVDNTNNHQEQELLTRRTLSSLQIKPCSHCAMPLNKMGGCDHIICPACHQEMCYKCGTHDYLQGQGYIRSCAGCRLVYFDDQHVPHNGALLCIYLPCCVVLMLLLPIIVLVQCIGRVIARVCCSDYSGRNQDVSGVLNSDDKEAGSDSIGGLTMTQIGTGPSTISRLPLHHSHNDEKTPNFQKPRDSNNINNHNPPSMHEDVETNIDNV